jgi:hypothetical protein
MKYHDRGLIMAKTFDPHCFELAEHFLSDHPHLNTEAAKTTLAAEIQDTIELEIQFMERSLEKA